MGQNTLSASIIRFYGRIVIAIVIFYIVLNAALAINTFFNMAALAKTVQDCVSLNGYLTKHDENMIRNTIAMYEKSNTEDSPIADNSEPTILGVDKVLRNIRIYVYDPDTDRGGSFPPNDNISYSSNPFAGSSRMNYKKQMGRVLYAGVTFDYYLIIPFMFWKTTAGGAYTAEISTNSSKNIFNYDRSLLGEFNSQDGVEDLRSRYEVEGAASGIKNVGDEGGLSQVTMRNNNDNYKLDNSAGQMSMFIAPVACTKYYPDLEQEYDYAGDD